MSNSSLYRLVNPPFELDWNGSVYQVKKASLAKVVLYQTRLREYVENKEKAANARLVAYGLFLVLKDVVPNLTEEEVLEKTPGDVEPIELLETLGFLKPTTEKPVQESQTTPDSSLPSATEPDGSQATSPN